MSEVKNSNMSMELASVIERPRNNILRGWGAVQLRLA
jgi:hypothetical protein